MTAAVLLPADVDAVPDLVSTPERARLLAADLRATAVSVKDVQTWAAEKGAPEWAGETQAAHDHAMTDFAGRVDTVEAVLDRALSAADRFEDRLTRLRAQRGPLVAERRDVHEDIAALRADVDAATDDARVEEFRRRAARLTERAATLRDEVAAWTLRRDDADQDFIRALAGTDTVAEGEVVAADPARVDPDRLAERLESLAGDPGAVAAWWHRLTRAQRQALMADHPGRVGNTDGVPAADRDEANRAQLDHHDDYYGVRESDGQLTPAEEKVLENVRTVRDGLDRLKEQVDPSTGLPLAHLLVYRPDAHGGDGGVAVSIGDPDTADHVSVSVPGFTTETSSLAGNLDALVDLRHRAEEAGAGSVATVYWADYDAPSGNPVKPWEVPDLAGVAFTAAADAGGERLGDFVDGLRATDEGERAHLTAIGHSYGSTTLGHALQDGAPVDDAVLVGSPGQPVGTAEELTAGDVWVGSMDNDPVSLLGEGESGGLGVLGQDPAEDDFGGTRFGTGDGEGRLEELLDNHSSYYEGESLDNMAAIVVDEDRAVTEQPHRGEEGGEYRTLEELLAQSTWVSGSAWVGDRVEDVGDLLADAWGSTWQARMTR